MARRALFLAQEQRGVAMHLTTSTVDELYVNAIRLKELECPLACTSCSKPLAGWSAAQRTCENCGACNVVFRSCFTACEAVTALRAVQRVAVTRTTYVPRFGWIVGFRRQTRRVA
jgi:hypothetical protein